MRASHLQTRGILDPRVVGYAARAPVRPGGSRGVLSQDFGQNAILDLLPDAQGFEESVEERLRDPDTDYGSQEIPRCL